MRRWPICSKREDLQLSDDFLSLETTLPVNIVNYSRKKQNILQIGIRNFGLVKIIS